MIIDPVFEQHARDVALVRELQLNVVYLLDTHVHADHVTSAWLLWQDAWRRDRPVETRGR